MNAIAFVTISSTLTSEDSTAIILPSEDGSNLLQEATHPLIAVLKASSQQDDCSVILLTDQDASLDSGSITREMERETAANGVATFVIAVDLNHANSSDDAANYIISVAKQLRSASWCLTMVVLSESPTFLSYFADISVRGRLLVWSTRLLVVSSLHPLYLDTLFREYWTFSMMNAMILNLEKGSKDIRASLYTYLPYSPDGPVTIKVASWTESEGLLRLHNSSLFPEKYRNFHGGIVNVTSLPFPPYWIEEELRKDDGTIDVITSGTDGLLLHAVSQSLNFNFYNVPTKSWSEVEDFVVKRISYISPVRWTVLPERLAKYDMTYVYEFAHQAFCKSKPSLQPQWQSLLDPLTNGVWLCILMCLAIVPGFLLLVSPMNNKVRKGKRYNAGMAILEILRTLLGQSFSHYLPKIDSGRILVAAWIIFAFIVGVAYKGNLTAHLTLPKYPPRPETLDELVDAVDTVGGASYRAVFREFFMKSSNIAYQKFADLLEIGVAVSEGMNLSLHNPRMAVTDSHLYMQHMIADKFTNPDGTTQLYIGRAVILPGQSAWLVPHDAPFKTNLESSMQAAIEAGLYEKWSWDVIGRTRQESMKRQREFMPDGDDKEALNEAGPSSFVSEETGKLDALSIVHMQGPLFLVFFGWGFASLSFILESLNGQRIFL